MPRKRQTAAAKHRAFLAANRHHYEPLLVFQGGGCAICKRGPVTRRLDMDHNHRTMTMRGLLCVPCNRMLRDWMTPEFLRAAADYLEAPPFDAYLATLV